MNIIVNKCFPPLNEKLTNYSTAVTLVTGQLTPVRIQKLMLAILNSG